ncbi:hypothetical protein K440DRAFT_593087 [Wilcoxina mikolae CBS 423.85]|nr:hypothetical protein K440DRAFT_593087 [Wilcoxina mikolae CBS 423.85]
MSRAIADDVHGISAAVEDLRTEAVAQNSWRENEEYEKVLNWLCQENFDRKHVRICEQRQIGTGGWLLSTPEFTEWRDGTSKSSILWGYGIPGAGKTVLCSLVIDHLMELATAKKYGVAYFYFDFGEHDQQRKDDVLCCLLRQLASMSVKVFDHVQVMYRTLRRGARPREEQLYKALCISLTYFTRTIFVFDALDECHKELQRELLLPLFQRLGGDGFRLFIASRPYPEDIQMALESAAKIELSAHEEDIRKFVEGRLEVNTRARLHVGRTGCKSKIVSQITQRASGM